MQVQPYQQSSGMMPTGTSLHSFGGDPRIHVPMGHAPIPPSLFSIFLSEIFKRKTLLFFWLLLTGAVAAGLVFKLAKPLYRAEGKLSYIPNYRSGLRPLYNPPNIQSMAQILKSMDAAESVRAKLYPEMSKEEFARNLRVEVSKMSEFLDVSYDSTDGDSATKIANAVLDESIVYFAKYRQTTLKERSAELKQDLQRAMADLEKAKAEFQKAQQTKGVTDLKAEIETARLAIADEERNLRQARETEAKLKLSVAQLTKRKDKPGETNTSDIDDGQLQALQALQNDLNQKLQSAQTYESAKFRVEQLTLEEERTRVLAARGVLPRVEYERTVADLKSAQALVKQHEASKEAVASMQAAYDKLKEQIRSGKSLKLNDGVELDKATRDLATMPEVIKGIDDQLKERRIALNHLVDLQRELGPKEEEIALARNRVSELSSQLTDSLRDKDPNADDLKIAMPATTGGGPFATNVPKLAASVFGGSALLFLGYIALFAIPAAMAGQAVASNLPPMQQPPRAVLAVVPVATASAVANSGIPMAPAPASTAAPVPNPETPPQPKSTADIPSPPKPEPKPAPVPVPEVHMPVHVTSSSHERISLDPPAPKVATAETKQQTPPQIKAPVPTEHEIIIPLEKSTENKPVLAPTQPASKVPILLRDLSPTSERISLPPPPAPKPAPSEQPAAAPLKPSQPVEQPTANPAVLALATRIAEEGVDRGSIVLFTPTKDQLQLAPIIGDLGRHLSQDGSRVLVFDARGGQETPPWAGPMAPEVSRRVEGYLDGSSESTQCFAPTMLRNVEYSRADLTQGVSGVMTAHRFRQLVEEMRERYSLVLMVAPPIVLEGNDPLLTALAEGLVIVTENNAQPQQIKAYIDSLAEQVPAPVFGALSVPKA